jgi:phosphoribosylaminoimidazole-succinocarboxamide synthase
LVSRGKVRDIYEIEDKLLFVATDRISAFDVVMKSGIDGKGKILTQLSCFWFDLLKDVVPNHLITADFDRMPAVVHEYRDQLEGRSLLVRKLSILPVESIVRGYITGSALSEYKQTGTVCGIPLPPGLVESQKLECPLFTPSTKAELGNHDENINPSKRTQFNSVYEIIGQEMTQTMARISIELYEKAQEYAWTKGIIIADTKFEFGLDENGQLVLADEILTPDSSRFWPRKEYQAGKSVPSFDKQFLRDYLSSVSFDKQNGIELPQNVISNTMERYVQVFDILTNKS